MPDSSPSAYKEETDERSGGCDLGAGQWFFHYYEIVPHLHCPYSICAPSLQPRSRCRQYQISKTPCPVGTLSLQSMPSQNTKPLLPISDHIATSPPHIHSAQHGSFQCLVGIPPLMSMSSQYTISTAHAQSHSISTAHVPSADHLYNPCPYSTHSVIPMLNPYPISTTHVHSLLHLYTPCLESTHLYSPYPERALYL